MILETWKKEISKPEYIGIEMKDIVRDQDTGHEDDGDIGPGTPHLLKKAWIFGSWGSREVKVNPED